LHNNGEYGKIALMDLRELEETADLAHLNVNKDELAAALPAFEQMLGFFAAMAGADKDPAVHTAAANVASGQAAGAALVTSGRFRGDAAPAGAASAETPAAELREKMLGNAGDRDGDFIVIPNVL
jgi:aspartyl-tRNA(Asn)/glutamyl-tRNA(Gln) amidotransferase subunit C